jgi:hypothetical protein
MAHGDSIEAAETRGNDMNQSFAEIDQGLALVGVVTSPHEGDTSVELLFDSSCQPPPHGMRSDTMGQRQMLYRADPYQIDLQLEADREHNRLIVAGQLLDVTNPEIACLSVQVMLSNLRGNVANTRTNQFGEFRGEVENSGDLELSFLGHGGTRIIILLRDVLE